jgi:hypothetical protein
MMESPRDRNKEKQIAAGDIDCRPAGEEPQRRGKVGGLFDTLVILAAFSCLVSGFWPPALLIERTTAGDTTNYRFSPWLAIVFVAGGLLVIPAGYLLLRWIGGGCALMAFGLAAIIAAGVGIHHDQVRVDAEQFELIVGFWLAPDTHRVRFDDLQSIRRVSRTTEGRWSHTVYELHCVAKDGSVQKVPIGDLMQHAVGEVLDRARGRAVPVIGGED